MLGHPSSRPPRAHTHSCQSYSPQCWAPSGASPVPDQQPASTRSARGISAPAVCSMERAASGRMHPSSGSKYLRHPLRGVDTVHPERAHRLAVVLLVVCQHETCRAPQPPGGRLLSQPPGPCHVCLLQQNKCQQRAYVVHPLQRNTWVKEAGKRAGQQDKSSKSAFQGQASGANPLCLVRADTHGRGCRHATSSLERSAPRALRGNEGWGALAQGLETRECALPCSMLNARPASTQGRRRPGQHDTAAWRRESGGGAAALRLAQNDTVEERRGIKGEERKKTK